MTGSSSRIANLAALAGAALILTTPVVTAADDDDVLLIEDFSAKKMMWYAKNDPVMGGKSTSTVMVEDDLGKFSGEVVDVPFLSAPGFVTMESRGGPYPDVHCCKGIDFTARAMTDYAGYRLSLGMGHAEGGRFAFGFKAPFQVGTEFGSVKIPFTDFSDNWDDATGDIKVTCAADKKFCPDENTLKDLGTMAFWGEGVDGVIDLEVKTVSAYGCTGTCGGYSNRNQNGGFGGGGGNNNNNNNGGFGGGNNNGGFGGGNNNGGFGGSFGRNNNNKPQPEVVQGSATQDIRDTIAVPLAVTAMLASLVSLFCLFQTGNTVKSSEQVVLVADTGAELA